MQAAFEEWYFKKLEDDLKKKQTAQAKEEAKLYAEEMEKLEKKENAAIEYEKWLQTKKEQLIKAKRRKHRRDASKEKVILDHMCNDTLDHHMYCKQNIIFVLFWIILHFRTRKKSKRESEKQNKSGKRKKWRREGLLKNNFKRRKRKKWKKKRKRWKNKSILPRHFKAGR